MIVIARNPLGNSSLGNSSFYHNESYIKRVQAMNLTNDQAQEKKNKPLLQAI